MSFYIRKSINFGPIRLNFSKSGIGISGGVKGVRVSTGPRGAYINMGSNGIYYRQKIGGFGGSSNRPHFRNGVSSESTRETQASSGENDSNSLVNTTETELISQINARIQQPSYTWAVSLVSIALSLAIGFI